MKHLVIPDTQVRPGVDTDHLTWIGRYIVDKRPDVIVHLGDHWDMYSLCKYDKGRKRCYRGASFQADIKAGNEAMNKLLAPLQKDNKRLARNKKAQYRPRMVFLIGNHEMRIESAIDEDPETLEGIIGFFQLNLGDWEVIPFLRPIIIDGVMYSHFFPRSANGRVMQNRRGAPNARLQVLREGMSCTAGHLQGLDVSPYPFGSRMQWGMIAGSCYLHDEAYLTEQGNNYWRGLIVKHEVKEGNYNPMFVGLDYLRRRYG